MFRVHLHRFFLINEVFPLILNLMLMFHLQLLILLLMVLIILPLFHLCIQLPIMLHLHYIMSHNHHLHHFHILLLLLDMTLGISILIFLLDLNHRILCLLHIILFNQGLTMVVPKEIRVVTNITKAEVLMKATSKEDGLVTLILVLLCNLSVRFVREGVTRLLIVFIEILHLLLISLNFLISLNVKFVGNVDTLRWSVIIEAIIKAVDKVTKEVLYPGRSRQNELFRIPIFKTLHSSVQHLPASTYLGQLIKSSVWHQRLGHPTNEVLSIMLQQSQINYVVDDQCTM
ncbi:uncharacterized protein LOC126594192 [Malus sylvestris]|uniref:uncharacterized protein LOC126594192 n=1 Tax=Malus sylvestris TaxID=3752 RepID=UPI0021ACDAAE|nr:uncharacterized protein LOC126594192 [Malus sylvestris]